MLLFDDAGCGVEDSEGRLAFPRVICDAQLEENGEQFRPRFIWWQVSWLVIQDIPTLQKGLERTGI